MTTEAPFMGKYSCVRVIPFTIYKIFFYNLHIISGNILYSLHQ